VSPTPDPRPTLAILRARIIPPVGHVSGLIDWRPGWSTPEYSYSGVLPGGSAARNNTRAADTGFELITTFQRSRRGPIPQFRPGELRAALVTAIRAEWKRLRERPLLMHIALYFSDHPTWPNLNEESLRKRIEREGIDLEALYEEARPID